jgi:small subunit ribosomal protein S11
MAEEKSAPKKEKPAKPAAEGAPATAPAEKKAKAPKAAADKAAKPGTEGAAPAEAGAPAEAAAPAKAVEMIHGVARQPTAEELLKEELGAIKVRKAKGSKNVISGVANVLASFNNTIVSITD